MKESIDGFEAMLADNCSCSTPNLRSSTESNSCSVNIAKVQNGLNTSLQWMGEPRAGQSTYSSLREFFESAEGIDFAEGWVELLKRCSDSNFQPYNGGIVPRCWWIEGGSPMYSGDDKAFISGFIDGAYIAFKNITVFPKTMGELAMAYAVMLQCNIVGEEWKDVVKLEQELRRLGHTDNTIISQAKASVVQLQLELTKDCVKYKKIRDNTQSAIKAFDSITSDYTVFSQFVTNLSGVIKKYFNETASTNPQARYNQGKLLFDVAGIFYGGTELNFAKRVKDILNSLPKIAGKVTDLANGLTKLQSLKTTELAAKVTEFKTNPSKFVEFANSMHPLYFAGKIRGVTFDMFLSFTERITNPNHLDDILHLWKNEKYKDLEFYINNHKLNDLWPPVGGFIDISEMTIGIGEKLDRFGGKGGSFASPYINNTTPASFNSRALPGLASDYNEIWEITILEPLEVYAGKSIPWFGKSGKGIQVKFKHSIAELDRLEKISLKRKK